jgi:type I restriction enzyme S subunit
LAKLCTLVSGQHIDREDYNTDGRGMPYLTGPSDFGLISPRITRWTETPKVTAVSGDVLVTVKGSGVGSVNLLDAKEVAISRQLMAVRAKGIDPRFLHAFLVGQQDYFQSLASGAAIPGITREHVLSLEIPLPTLEAQRRIVVELDAEAAQMEAVRLLLPRFEAKIQCVLDRVWGNNGIA